MGTAKDIAWRFFKEVCNDKNINLIEVLVANDVINHDPVIGEKSGIIGLKELLTGFFSSFPDLYITVEFMISENDLVVSRVKMQGTHLGNFMGKEGSGLSFTMHGMEAFRVKQGKIVERWANFDDLSMLKQLKIIYSKAILIT